MTRSIKRDYFLIFNENIFIIIILLVFKRILIKIVTSTLIIAYLFFFYGFYYLEVSGQQLANNSNNSIITGNNQNFDLTSSDIQELKDIAKNISMQSEKIIKILTIFMKHDICQFLLINPVVFLRQIYNKHLILIL